jgi:hypothetical protein
MRSRLLFWLTSALLVAAFPLVLLAALLPLNEYEGMGLSGVDCDSPAAIVMLALVVYLGYGSGLVAFTLLARRSSTRSRRYVMMAIYCLAALLVITPNASRAWFASMPEECSYSGQPLAPDSPWNPVLQLTFGQSDGAVL